MREIITRKEAREKGLKKYFTGRPCPHGHVAERYTEATICVICAVARAGARNKRLAKGWNVPYSRASRSRLLASKPWYECLHNAKCRAKKAGLPFDLDSDWATCSWTGRCALTGVTLQRELGGLGPLSPSIDKIEPALGYTKGNCRFVCFAVNALKSSGTDATNVRLGRAPDR